MPEPDLRDPAKAVAYLLGRDIAFLNQRRYVTNPWDAEEKWEISDGPTVCVFVNVSDVFAWGCTDSEHITFGEHDGEPSELRNLVNDVLEDEAWGAAKWACKKRNMQPQAAVIKQMKEAGVWDDVMEGLRENPGNSREAGA